MDYQTLTLASGGLSVLLLLATVWLGLRMRRLDALRREFFTDETASTVDEVITRHNQEIRQVTDRMEAMEQYASNLTEANTKNHQKIGFVRFNPFNDAGGSISFVLAVLDAHDNGFVLSSLHGRDGNRVYAKEVSGGTSKSQLTDEEREAIKQAK